MGEAQKGIGGTGEISGTKNKNPPSSQLELLPGEEIFAEDSKMGEKNEKS